MYKPKIVSLFSGAGGMDLGFKMAGYNVIWANDIDKWAIETHKKNFPETQAVLKDISEISSDEIPECDVIIGGFPCQDFSVLGKKQGLQTKRGRLYKEFVRVVRDKKPKVFVAENVKGILTANNKLAIQVIKHDFEYLSDINLDSETEIIKDNSNHEKEYHVFINLYKLVEYGVPQIRERVFIVGIKKDIYNKEFKKPEPIITNPNDYISCKQVFDGNALYYYEDVSKAQYNNEHLNVKQSTIELLKLIPEGCNYKCLPPEYAIKGLTSNIYKRLHRNKPSYTIIANGGGGTWGYHYDEPRPITNRERARLQSFPDNFIFEGSINEVRRQIGNAVPPIGIMPVAFELKKYLINKYNLENDEFYKNYIKIIKRK